MQLNLMHFHILTSSFRAGLSAAQHMIQVSPLEWLNFLIGWMRVFSRARARGTPSARRHRRCRGGSRSGKWTRGDRAGTLPGTSTSSTRCLADLGSIAVSSRTEALYLRTLSGPPRTIFLRSKSIFHGARCSGRSREHPWQV